MQALREPDLCQRRDGPQVRSRPRPRCTLALPGGLRGVRTANRHRLDLRLPGPRPVSRGTAWPRRRQRGRPPRRGGGLPQLGRPPGDGRGTGREEPPRRPPLRPSLAAPPHLPPPFGLTPTGEGEGVGISTTGVVEFRRAFIDDRCHRRRRTRQGAPSCRRREGDGDGPPLRRAGGLALQPNR